MNPPPDDSREARLERALHRTLRDLPARRAPRTLEERVRAEIARRAALPWWRRSFAHWPLPARAVFLVGCAGVVKLALMASVWVMAGFDVAEFRAAFATQLGWMDAVVTVFHAIGSLFDIVGRNIPPLWLYGALAFFAAMYAALFGLGAAAYKALRANA